ncbi:MAG: tetratricopeptide repeat protein, partial [Anaerolineae bacterium]|nr:tetratricopeptide repeat protein [Anaerolineae bacterium]
LNGLHLEQYRHATFQPEPYYEEALRRDPLDSRCNNALGLLLLRRGKFADAEAYFRQAIRGLTRRNPNPYDGEPYYNLGLALKMQGRHTEAYDAFYKAVWSAAWQPSAYFELARLACRDGHFEVALEHVNRSLAVNGLHHQARHLKVALLRHLGQTDQARQLIEDSLAQDRMNYGIMVECDLLNEGETYRPLLRGDVHNFIEISLDYAHAGLLAEAIALLKRAPAADPMVAYYLGWYSLQTGDEAAAREWFTQARALPPDYCFPNRVECVPALQAAMMLHPDDARAPYYLGNFWYAHRRYAEAIDCWEQARRLDPTFPTVQRNLGLAYMNKRQDSAQALAAYEEAFRLDPTDARVFFELDQLHRVLRTPPADRLARLEAHAALVDQRDDLTIERVSLLNLLGRPDEALALISKRNFHPWEGGEGKISGQYVASLVEQARQHLEADRADEARDCLERARVYPHNLGEGKLAGAQENHLDYYLGCAYEQLGDADQARRCFERASTGLTEPSSPLYYNDQPPDMIYYQGLAREKLGQRAEARQIFQMLVDYGLAHQDDVIHMDYFAVSLPDFLVFDEDLSQRNRIHCHYMTALGYLGLGEHVQAQVHFDAVLKITPHHFGAAAHRRLLTAIDATRKEV